MGEALLVRRGGSGSGKKTAGDYNVGSHVYLNWNGVSTPFIVVHQGLPSSIYDSSCEGTWLMQMECAKVDAMDETGTYYAQKTILQNYLNEEYLNKFDSRIISAIKQVKIPYHNGSSVMTGANGLSTKPFLLSAREVGADEDNFGSATTEDGACLDYFGAGGTINKSANAARIAYVDAEYWLRSTHSDYGWSYYVELLANPSGRDGSVKWESTPSWYDEEYDETYYKYYGYRPAFIVDYKTVLED